MLLRVMYDGREYDTVGEVEDIIDRCCQYDSEFLGLTYP